MKRRKKLIYGCLAACILGLHVKAFSQTADETSILGEVRDINTHEKIRGVNIFIKDTGIGTSSDFSGEFRLEIPRTNQKLLVVFQHIAYEIKTIPLDSLPVVHTVYLQPRVIPLQGVEIQEQAGERLEIDKDLPQTVSVIRSQNFEIQGYVDAGDLLRVDHSVQIDEELSGQKTISIRGGNPDEVVVLYNGMKMNSTYDNIFDLSLIDLEDVDRLEIIKGSNTALYGPEAFSGVINIVPKMQYDYTVRFQQRLGTYRSGNWGLHVYKKLGRLNASYSLKRGGLERSRDIPEVPVAERRLDNTSLHHTANLSYSLSEHADGTPENALALMWIYTSLDYNNHPDNEFINNFNNMFTLKYTGNVAAVKDIDFGVAYKNLEEDLFLSIPSGRLDRNINDKAINVNAQKSFDFGASQFLFAYQFERATLDFLNERRNLDQEPSGLASSKFQRIHHGFVTIAKLRNDGGSDFLQDFNIDVSLRHDRVKDNQSDPQLRDGESNSVGIFGDNSWNETMFKFSSNAAGYRSGFLLETFLNFGSNVKFPTLFQQVNTSDETGLAPEKNRSLEIGAAVTRDIKERGSLYGWRVSANYFLNNYENKFVEVPNLLGGRVEFFSTPVARISGFEAKSSLYMFRKKVTVNVGWSRYFISDQEAFPFKSDFKRITDLRIDHAGYSFQIHWFKEGEQTGLLLAQAGGSEGSEPVRVFLPDYTNLDVHLSKTFEIGPLRLFGNFSARNLLNDNEVELVGLNIRDRRFYFTFGAEL